MIKKYDWRDFWSNLERIKELADFRGSVHATAEESKQIEQMLLERLKKITQGLDDVMESLERQIDVD